MFITSLLLYVVIRHKWHFHAVLAIAITAPLLAVDGMLVVSCLAKVLQGGWFPLLLGLALFVLMTTWRRGRAQLTEHAHQEDPQLQPFLDNIGSDPDLQRIPRTAIFPTAHPQHIPAALLHNMKHNEVLHARNVILNVQFGKEPWIPLAQRVIVTALPAGFWLVQVNYGFKEQPDIPDALALCHPLGLELDPARVSYFLSREVIAPSGSSSMTPWRARLFSTMFRNAGSAADFFQLPDNCVIELGTRVQL